jgi:hypothetical protein
MLAILRSVVFTVIAAIFALVIGAHLGGALGHGIAVITGRDPAELKDMMIWCMIGATFSSGAGAIWAMMFVLKAHRGFKIAAGVLFCLVALASISITALTYIEAPRYGARR